MRTELRILTKRQTQDDETPGAVFQEKSGRARAAPCEDGKESAFSAMSPQNASLALFSQIFISRTARRLARGLMEFKIQ